MNDKTLANSGTIIHKDSVKKIHTRLTRKHLNTIKEHMTKLANENTTQGQGKQMAGRHEDKTECKQGQNKD